MQERITIKDVAKKANVSISTVSRVLNKSCNVKPELSDRVWSAANSLNYQPNEVARDLKSRKTTLIAFVVSNTADPFFTMISRALEEKVYAAGYNLIVCSTNFSLSREQRFLTTLSKRRVAGIVINSVGSNEEMLAELSQNIPIILSNRAVKHPKFSGDLVDFDNIGGMRDLTRHLLELGHREIGVISGPLHLSTASERFDGFKKAMGEYGIEVDDNYNHLALCNKFSLEEGVLATEELLCNDSPPSAVIATNSEFSLGVLKYCRSRGVKIPEDLSLVSFGETQNSDLLYTRPTFQSLDLKILGDRIGELLLDRIENGDDIYVNREVRFQTQLHLCDTSKEFK